MTEVVSWPNAIDGHRITDHSGAAVGFCDCLTRQPFVLDMRVLAIQTCGVAPRLPATPPTGSPPVSPMGQYPELMTDRPAALCGGQVSAESLVSHAVSLKVEVLTLLLEPLGIDAMIGIASLERLLENVDAIAQEFGIASRPTSGSTFRWVSDAVAVCVEEHELVGLATAQGGGLTLDGAKAVRELMRLEGLQAHHQALEGVPVEALRAGLAALALAERRLPGVVERCRRADQGWPEEFRRSIHEIDVDRAVTVLRRRRRGWQRTADVRELVLEHAATAARDLENRDLVTLLEKVQELDAAMESYEAVLSDQPEWWRWLVSEPPFGFRSDRRDALLWAIEARDTGLVSASTLEMLADCNARAVIEHRLALGRPSAAEPVIPPSPSSAGRLAEGLLAVSSRTDISELRALDSWYAKDVERLDRVAAAMDARRSDPSLNEALDSLVGELADTFGGVGATRSAYRDIQFTLRGEIESRLHRTAYSAHAVENEDLVGAITRIGTFERELGDAVRALPPVRGRLVVAIAGRTKSGKTTLRKALTRDADRAGIGRGRHRTTRHTGAFDHGPVTFLDTPGFAAKDDDSDAERARAACEVADAVIWNYADTLREEESGELHRLLLSGKPLLVVVNVKQRVDALLRLRRFADDPERAFGSLAGHVARVNQVCTSIGVSPPTVLSVHSGAAHEALSTSDSDLRASAFQASRLPELEESLARLLTKRAVPIRAIRLADAVRAPLASLHDALAEEMPQIGSTIDELERSTPSHRAELLAAIQDAGQSTRNELEAKRHVATARLSRVVPHLGGADHERQWSDFIADLELDTLPSRLESEFEKEMHDRGRVLRAQARTDERRDERDLRVQARPDVDMWHRMAEAAKGAATDVIGSFAARGIARKLGAGAAGGPTGTAVVAVSYVLDAVSGGAKAVNRDVERARQAMDDWTGVTAVDAEATLEDLFARIDERLAHIVEDATTRVSTQFDGQSADISHTRERFEQLHNLKSAVDSALESIDLVLARRLLALTGGDSNAVRSARRVPGVEFCIGTDEVHLVGVQECLQDELFGVLTERLEICSSSGNLVATAASARPSDGKTE